MVVKVVSLLTVSTWRARNSGLRRWPQRCGERRGRHWRTHWLVRELLLAWSGREGSREVRIMLTCSDGCVVELRGRDRLADIPHDLLHLTHVRLDGRNVNALTIELLDFGCQVRPRLDCCVSSENPLAVDV